MPAKIKLFQRDREALELIKIWIDEHPDEAPSLFQLCRLSGLNTDKLKKGFRNLFGLPPYSYHLQQKMKKAQCLLRETEDSIFTIAVQLGYEHVSSFSNAFKKEMGCSPLGYRKEISMDH